MSAQAVPLLKMNSALLNAGYKVSLSHCAENSIKTNAPPAVVWDVMRCWATKECPNTPNMKEDSVAAKLRAKPIQLEACFDNHPQANPPSRKIKLTRFEDHHGKQWGPKSRAKRQREDTQDKDKEDKE